VVTKEVKVNGQTVGSYESTGSNDRDAEIARKIAVDKGGLPNEIPLAWAMYSQGQAFTRASKYVFETSLHPVIKNGMDAPAFVVNITFAIEVFLKAVHEIATPGVVLKSHDLGPLFDKLPQAARDALTAQAKIHAVEWRIDPNFDIRTGLFELGRSFEVWRYLYEVKRTGQLKIRDAIVVANALETYLRGRLTPPGPSLVVSSGG
jgi:hypothetical protein